MRFEAFWWSVSLLIPLPPNQLFIVKKNSFQIIKQLPQKISHHCPNDV